GTGKSTILQAIALALIGDNYRSLLHVDPGKFVRRGSKSGYVELVLTGTRDPLRLSFSKRGFKCSDPDPKVLVLAYGATRLLPRGVTHRLHALLAPSHA